MKATRIKGDGIGVVYEIVCNCYVCRTVREPFGVAGRLLCEGVTSFIRALPEYARFVLRPTGPEADIPRNHAGEDTADGS